MKNRKGVVLVMGIFLIFILFGVFSYIYETGRLTIAKIKAQNAADAAAAAGQIVYSNMRNNAQVNYALMELYDKMAKNAARWQYAMFMKALKKVYHDKDWTLRNDEKRLVEDEWKAIHHAFHVQDACVSRFFASYESKVVKFRGIYAPQRVREYIVKRGANTWIKDIVNYNLFPVPDEEEAMANPTLFPFLWKPVTLGGIVSKKYPFITPWMSGINYPTNNRFPDYSGSSDYVRVDYDRELQLDRLGRFFARVRVYLTPTVFEKFITMNWLKQWNFHITPPGFGYIYATAAAQPKVFSNNSVYIYNVTHLPNFMLSIPISGIMGEQDRYFGQPFWPDIPFGLLPKSDNFEWYWPTITRVVQDHGNNLHH